jgi:hypothetical protein
MNLDRPFASPLALVRGAKKDIVHIEKTCARFFQNAKCVSVEEHDRKTGEKVIKIRIKKVLPDNLLISCSRTINDLRHALDQAAADGALVLGATEKVASRTYFPFARCKDEFERQLQDKCRGMDAGLRSFLAAFQAYCGGDTLLWSLGKLANMKHRRLVGIGAKPLAFIPKEMHIQGPAQIGINRWDDRRNELEFARIGPGGKIDMQFQVPLEIVVNKADVMQGEPLTALLYRFSSKVAGIVSAVEAETWRLKKLQS